MDIRVDDQHLEGFNEQARGSFRKAISDYSLDVVTETLRIESSRRTSGANVPEVTSTIVDTAVSFLRNGFGAKKKSKSIVALKVASNIFWVTTGGMFFSPNMTNQLYLIGFVFVLVAAVITSTLSLLLE